MTTIAAPTLVIALSLAAGIVLAAGSGGVASAQDDPAILLKLCKGAHDQISGQISDDSPDEIRTMFEMGTDHMDSLEQALQSDNQTSAREHFLSAMDIFKEVSMQMPMPEAGADNGVDASDPTTPASQASPGEEGEEESGAAPNARDPAAEDDLERLSAHVENLKAIAAKHGATIDFSELDGLFAAARQHIDAREYQAAHDTLDEIRGAVVLVGAELREEASKQESERARDYAQRYLGKIDRLIENARERGIADNVIGQLEAARGNLSSAHSPDEIVLEIRNVMSIKEQFGLTAYDALESKVMHIEDRIERLDGADGVDQDALDGVRDALDAIKERLAGGESEGVGAQLSDLRDTVDGIAESAGQPTPP